MSEDIRHIGIIGDGQLGRMITQAALPLGNEVTVLGSAGPDSPAAQVGANQLHGSLTDGDAIRQLAEMTDVVTWEIEHVNADALRELEIEGYNIQPSPNSLSVIQDKLTQKLYLDREGIPVAPFDLLGDAEDLAELLQDFGRVIAKTRTGGYDGRGNLVLEPNIQWQDVIAHFTDAAGNKPGLYAEQIIDFQRELAVIGARDMAGRIALYPVVETVHKDNICHTVVAPADIDPRVIAEAEEIGRATIEAFGGAGVFAVEMFQDANDTVIVNEVAPRVHNSGHYSIEGAATSQFEQHVRAITGNPLGNTEMTAPAAAMVNILGNGPGELTDEMKARLPVEVLRNAFIHWYGKAPRAARKIGHITVLGKTARSAEAKALAIRDGIRV